MGAGGRGAYNSEYTDIKLYCNIYSLGSRSAPSCQTLFYTHTLSCVRVHIRACLAVGCLFHVSLVSLERSRESRGLITPDENTISLSLPSSLLAPLSRSSSHLGSSSTLRSSSHLGSSSTLRLSSLFGSVVKTAL